MSAPFMSQVEAFAFDFAPRNWMQCNGQLLLISQNQGLFALLGTMYGGDGVRTFALPDLRGRFAVGMGQGTGLPNYIQGEQVGEESVTLVLANMSAAIHTHNIRANTDTTGGTNQPGGNVALSSAYVQEGTLTPVPFTAYSTAPPVVAMGSLAQAGGQPHENRSPSLAINYCICIQGIFPSRN
jgi:microcystin-dependent protein